MKTELLAPAKDKETAFAAINAGCDALYIGANLFGARQAAGNSIEDIKEIVNYAHKFYVRVHVTINTILTDEELVEAQKLIEKLYNIGVDAIIVQDMGIFKLALEGKLPPIALHASTQCDNRTLEKIQFFDKLGVSRVILARELSIPQIETICKNTSCEIETFIHGALCVCYSGQCYLSHSIGGRSANRGQCAQPCRKKYTLVNEQGKILAKSKHLLSLKDFNCSKHIQRLVDAGVKSFKIEGRLKDKNYVKNVVFSYRKELDKYSQKASSGKIFTDFEPDINKTFNREYTDYFLEKRKVCYNFETPKFKGEKLGKVKFAGKNFIEIDTKEKIHNQDGLCYFKNGELAGFLVNRVDKNQIYPSKVIDIKIGDVIYRNYDREFDDKIKSAKFKRKIKVDFKFSKDVLLAIDEDKNESKIKLLENKSPQNPPKMIENFKNQLKKTGETDFYTGKIEILSDLPFIPISKINEYRRILLDELMKERLKNYKRDVQNNISATNFPLKEIDYHGNVHNQKAKEFYEICHCNVKEFSIESGSNPFELMRTKHCLKYAFGMCKSPDKLYLVDDTGKKYPLRFDCKNCEMIILAK